MDTAQLAVDTLVQSLAADPEPPLVVTTLLLSLVTGNILGHSITDTIVKMEGGKKEKERKEKERKEKEKKKEMTPMFDNNNCPEGYELIYMQDGLTYLIKDTKSRTLPFPLPGMSFHVEDGYYCRDPDDAPNIIGGGKEDGGKGKGGGGKGDDGVGITVNDGGIYYTKQGVPKIPSHLDKNSSFLGHPVMNK